MPNVLFVAKYEIAPSNAVIAVDPPMYYALSKYRGRINQSLKSSGSIVVISRVNSGVHFKGG